MGQSGKIDILSKGYIVAPPSRHQSGHRYGWRGERATVAPPTWMVEALQDANPSLYPSLPSTASIIPTIDNPFPFPPVFHASVCEPEVTYVAAASVTTNCPHREEEDIWDALGWIPAEDYELWLRVGMALHYWDHRGEGRGRGRLLWDRWSEWGCPYKFDRHAQEKTWQSFDPDGGVRLQTLFHLANEYKNSFKFVPSPVEYQIAFRSQIKEKKQTLTESNKLSQETEVLQAGLLRLHKQNQTAFLGTKSVALTTSELEILELLMGQPGHTIAFQSFVEALYSHHDSHIRLNIKESLRQHVCRLRNKLEELGADRDSISNVRGHGYRLQLSEEKSDTAL